MKHKSNKLSKLERNRYSIITGLMDYCYCCGKEACDIHEVYGGRNRQQSMKFGFCIPLCRYCHQCIETDVGFDMMMKRKVQQFFEENHSRSEFMRIIGRNYLD